MVKCKIVNAVGNENSISLTVLPSSGNIRGKINIPCPENIIKIENNGRKLTKYNSNIIARKLIDKEYDFALFGQMSKKQLRKDLKRRGLWMEKNLKREVNYEEKKIDEKTSRLKYSEMLEMISNLNSVEKIDDFDLNGKKVTFFTKEGITILDIAKEFEGLEFLDYLKSVKKLEVR